MTKDGTAEFVAVDARAAAIFDLIYPVGAVFATTGSAPARGTWEEIAQGRTLQGADSSHAVGTTIAAGLPNITGGLAPSWGSYIWVEGSEYGALLPAANNKMNNFNNDYQINSNAPNAAAGITFNASKSNTIYGASTTVQPPAYVVHFYRRTA